MSRFTHEKSLQVKFHSVENSYFLIHIGKYFHVGIIEKAYLTKYFDPNYEFDYIPHKHIHPPVWEQKMVWQVNKESNNGQIDLLFDFRRLKEWWSKSNKKDVYRIF